MSTQKNFLVYSVPESTTQYVIGDLERPGSIKPEVYEIYVGQPGQKGSKGDVGPQGPVGADGQAATITIGTVTSGSTPSVTNVGTSTNAVFDFVLVPGQDGSDGAAATISVGTTTTGQPGTNASVTNSGTSSAAVFDFVIPQGQTGQTGATGPGVPQGGTQGQILAKSSSTDYDTEWINAPSGGETNVYKEEGSYLIIYLASADDLSLRLKFNSVISAGQYLDWGDGSEPVETAANTEYTHTYTSLGYKKLTIYGKSWLDHYMDISYIRRIGNNYNISLLYAYASDDCINVNIGVGGTGQGFIVHCDWKKYQYRVLKTYKTFDMVSTELELPIASEFNGCCSVDSVKTSVVIPSSCQTITNLFPRNGGFSNLKKLEIKTTTPPTLSSLGYLPSGCIIVVPWSADHSVYNAYKSASGWSTYANDIYEAPGPTQPAP